MSTADGATALKGETTIVELSRAERTNARRTAEARATVPDLELSADVDAGGLHAIATTHDGSVTAALVHACACALRAHPRANAAYRDGRFELYSRVNVAVTMAGLESAPSPTVLDADTKPLPVIEAELAELAARARAGGLISPDQAGATFTLTDFGAWPVSRPGALVVPPQAAALAAGAIRAVPVVRDGAVVPGHRVALMLACDSRILFGALAAAFLTAITEILAELRPPDSPEAEG